MPELKLHSQYITLHYFSLLFCFVPFFFKTQPHTKQKKKTSANLNSWSVKDCQSNQSCNVNSLENEKKTAVSQDWRRKNLHIKVLV